MSLHRHATARASEPTLQPGVHVGRILRVCVDGTPEIELATGPVRVRPAVDLFADDVGRDAVVTVPWGEHPPIVTAVLRPLEGRRVDAIVDGDRIVLTADRELELRCGDASIILTADGRVTIRGEEVLSAATGVHRVSGACIKLNS